MTDQAFTLKDIFIAIRRHFVTVVLLTVMGGAAGYATSARMTSKYQAQSSLILDPELPAIVAGESRTPDAFSEQTQIATIAITVNSGVVIEQALATLPPEVIEHLEAESSIDENLRAAGGSEPDERVRRDYLVQFVSSQLEVSNNGQSYLILVSYRSTDADVAAHVVNAISAGYLDYRLGIRRQIFSKMLEGVNSEITQLEKDLTSAERTAQTMREKVHLLAIRKEALTPRQQDDSIAASAELYARQRDAERKAEVTAAVFERLLLNRREIQSLMNVPDLDLQVFSVASAPLEPSGLNIKPVLLLLGLMGGALIGTSFAIVFYRSKRR